MREIRTSGLMSGDGKRYRGRSRSPRPSSTLLTDSLDRIGEAVLVTRPWQWVARRAARYRGFVVVGSKVGGTGSAGAHPPVGQGPAGAKPLATRRKTALSG